MKQPRLTLSALFLALLLLGGPPLAQAAEGTILSKTTSNVLPNVTYTNTVAQHAGGRVESFTLTASPSSTVYPIAVQGSGYIYGGGSIQNAVSKAEGMGYNVIGGINSDYFSLSTGVPTGIVIENGIYKSSPSEHSSILFNDMETTILGPTSLPITLENNRSGANTTVYHLNKHRADTGGLYLFNSDFSATTTQTSTEGIMVRLTPTYDQLQTSQGSKLSVNCTLSLTVTEVLDTSYPWSLEGNDLILTAAHESGYREVLQGFAPGDSITLKISTSNQALSQAQWASGGGDVMISNGTLTSSSSWIHTYEGRAPRTALGVKADGSLVYYAVDGRQTGYSVGLSQVELANHLLEEGCVWAVNLDGGGSTSFTLTDFSTPHILTSPVLTNSPSDGRMRSCATYLLFVDPQIPSQITMEYDQQPILTGSQITLGSAYVRDVNETILEKLKDSSLDTLSNLGTLGSYTDQDGCPVYHYSPLYAGTEEFMVTSSSHNLDTIQTLNVVEYLSQLSITLKDSSQSVTAYELREGQQITFDFVAQTAGQQVTANGDALRWNLQPGLEATPGASYGSISTSGVYTAGTEPAILQLSAGGQTATVNITVRTMFDDVPSDHWAYDAIAYLKDNQVIGGITETTFGLGQDIRRADFVMMLHTALGSPSASTNISFSDVAPLDYYANAVDWAVAKNVSTGLGDGTFGSTSSLTREQSMVILYQVAESFGVSIPATSLSLLSQYTDYSSISAYAQPSIAALTGQNLLTDSTTTIQPQDALLRESMAVYLYHLLTAQEETLLTPTQLAIYPSEVSLAPGGHYNLTAVLQPAGSAAQVTWTSSDPSAVTVSSTGTIKNVFAGTGQPLVTITARTDTLTATAIVRCVALDSEIPEIPPLVYNPSDYQAPDIQEPEVDLPLEDGQSDDQSQEDLLTPEEPEDGQSQEEPLLPDDSSDSNTGSDSQTSTAPTGIVIDAPGGLNVRIGPSSSSSVVTQLPQGSIVNIHNREFEGWLQISCQVYSEESKMTSNIQGYVMSQYIQEKTLTAVVFDAEVGLNLRSGAGAAFDVIAKIPNSTRVTILQAFTGWYKVAVTVDGHDLEGFVSSDFLEIQY